MGRTALYNWEELLKEYLASEYVTKTDFAKAKGINPSLLRRNTVNWPNKGRGETESKLTQDSKKKLGNVTEKDVTKKSNRDDVTKKVTEKTNSQKLPHDQATEEAPLPGTCGARSKQGKSKYCQLPSGFGTNHVGTGRCKFHGGCSPGAPKGNNYTVKTGEFVSISKLFSNVLTADEKTVIDELNLEKVSLINQELQLITAREYYMLSIKKKTIEAAGDELGSLITSIETTTEDDEDDGQKNPSAEPGYAIINITPGMDVFTPTHGRIQGTIKIKKKEEGIIGTLLDIEEALTRVQAQKSKLLLLKHKFEIVEGNEEDAIEEFYDALNGAGEVWNGNEESA